MQSLQSSQYSYNFESCPIDYSASKIIFKVKIEESNDLKKITLHRHEINFKNLE